MTLHQGQQQVQEISGSSWSSFFGYQSASFVSEDASSSDSESNSFTKTPPTTKKLRKPNSAVAESDGVDEHNLSVMVMYERSVNGMRTPWDGYKRESIHLSSSSNGRVFLDNFGDEECPATVKKQPLILSTSHNTSKTKKSLKKQRPLIKEAPPPFSWVTTRKKLVTDDYFSCNSNPTPAASGSSTFNDDCFKDADETFEQFLIAAKTPTSKPKDKEKRVVGRCSESFIVSDSSDVENSPEFYLKSLSERVSRIRVSPSLERSRSLAEIVDLVTDSDEEKERPKSQPHPHSPLLLHYSPISEKKKKTKQKGRIQTISSSSESESPVKPLGRSQTDPALSSDAAFLKSLSPALPSHRRHKDAHSFVSNFKKNRGALTRKLYTLYNEKVFDLELPSDLEITWNVRLTKTAGFCCYKKNSKGGRVARIELSDKVCDSSERVRDTLIHEMCHAAVWIVHGKKDGGHGKIWKLWAQKAVLVFPSLPLVTRCHSYEIRAKYTYRCEKCKQEIHRHSKSLDTQKKVCGICHGKFQLTVNSKSAKRAEAEDSTSATPKQTPKFALFVKENYGSVKKESSGRTHKEIMSELGQQFRKKTVIS